MALVEPTHRLDGLVELHAGEPARGGVVLAHGLDAAQRMAQLHQVHLAELGEQGAHPAELLGVLLVHLEDVEAAPEEAEVARAAAEHAVEVGVVALRPPPSRR